MALALTIKSVNTGMRKKRRLFKVAASGNYVTGGDTVNLASLLNPGFIGDANFGSNNITDFAVEQCPAGYGAELIPGTTLANWKLKIFTTANTELAAAAYPAAITADAFYLSFSGDKAIV
jgi:hypothetical protein